MKLKLVLFSALCIRLCPVFAQAPDSTQTANISLQGAPTQIELFTGNNGLAFQLLVSKQFSPQSKFGFFNVTNFTGDYKTNQTSDFLSQSLVTAEVFSGISLAAGLSAMGASNTPSTVQPTVALQYLLTSRDVVIVVLPQFDITQLYNIEMFAVLEYKPMLSKNWGIYIRVQWLCNYNAKLGCNELSEINLRLGLSYKNFQFGIGSIHDFYGSDEYNVNNYGLFIKTDLF
jgi:hypothetical protein